MQAGVPMPRGRLWPRGLIIFLMTARAPGVLAAAFAPANGSLIFQTYEAGPGHGRGSLGVGFTLCAGVTAQVSRSNRPEVRVGGREWDFPTVRDVLQVLAPEPVRVEIEAQMPFGCGFGMSGASALATALALGRAFHPEVARDELALVAHEAEVVQGTGRGDVGGQFNGGFMMKTEVGRPLAVRRLPIPEQTLYCRVFGPISTREVLADAAVMRRVNEAGAGALRRLSAMSEVDVEGLLFLARDFAEEAGLLRSQVVRRSIAEAELMGGRASMVMLGEAVVSTVPIPGARAYRACVCPARVLEEEPAQTGPAALEVV